MSIVSKMNVIFDLTNSFKDAYNPKTKETQIQKVLESRLVAGTGFFPTPCFGKGQEKNSPKKPSGANTALFFHLCEN